MDGLVERVGVGEGLVGEVMGRGGLAAVILTLTSTSAATTATTVVDRPARMRPTAAARQAIMTCQVRSLLRSECPVQMAQQTASTLLQYQAALNTLVLRIGSATNRRKAERLDPSCIPDARRAARRVLNSGAAARRSLSEPVQPKAPSAFRVWPPCGRAAARSSRLAISRSVPSSAKASTAPAMARRSRSATILAAIQS